MKGKTKRLSSFSSISSTTIGREISIRFSGVTSQNPSPEIIPKKITRYHRPRRYPSSMTSKTCSNRHNQHRSPHSTRCVTSSSHHHKACTKANSLFIKTKTQLYTYFRNIHIPKTYLLAWSWAISVVNTWWRLWKLDKIILHHCCSQENYRQLNKPKAIITYHQMC